MSTTLVEQDVVGRARALVERLRSRHAETDRLSKATDETSADLATSPRLRASSSFRGEASSDFVEASFSSATGAPHTNTPT